MTEHAIHARANAAPGLVGGKARAVASLGSSGIQVIALRGAAVQGLAPTRRSLVPLSRWRERGGACFSVVDLALCAACRGPVV